MVAMTLATRAALALGKSPVVEKGDHYWTRLYPYIEIGKKLLVSAKRWIHWIASFESR